MRPVVVLVGPPGAGKTTVGRELALLLGVPFRDTDEDLVCSQGRTIAEVFVDEGEERFRQLEEVAVDIALHEHRGVLSLGGGAVMSEATRQRLQGHCVVLLDIDAATSASRVGFDRGRPVMALNPRSLLGELLAKRGPYYREVSTCVVDANSQPPAFIALTIVKFLRRADDVSQGPRSS